MMSLSGIHREGFQTRLAVSELYTKLVMKPLEKTGHFLDIVRKASVEEDFAGIDWWVKYSGQPTEIIPIQFKLREKRYDCPVCRLHPLHGIDSPKNEAGRDFRGLQDHMSEYYYIAVRDENGLFDSVYRMNSETLNNVVTQADDEWSVAVTKPTARPRDMWGGTYGKNYFTSDNVSLWLDERVSNKPIFKASNGVQFWWKKNFNERHPKINMYVPRKYRDWDYDIHASDARCIENIFRKVSGQGKAPLE